MSSADCVKCGHVHGWRSECDGLVPIPARPHMGAPCYCRWGSARNPQYDRGRYVPAAVRRAVIERDGLVCGLCGKSVRPRSRRGARGAAARRALHLDHIHPHSFGGQPTIDNLRVLCASCNTRRGNRVTYEQEG